MNIPRPCPALALGSDSHLADRAFSREVLERRWETPVAASRVVVLNVALVGHAEGTNGLLRTTTHHFVAGQLFAWCPLRKHALREVPVTGAALAPRHQHDALHPQE